MKYAFIYRNRRVWPISVQCRVLRVSVAGYHEHFVRRRDIVQRRHLSDEALLVHIRAVYEHTRRAYACPRIWRQLRSQGIRVGKLRVQRLMQHNDIRARGKRRFRIATTDSLHRLPIAPNLLDRNFTVAAPNLVWVGDVTYISTDEGGCFWPLSLTCLAAGLSVGRWVSRLPPRSSLMPCGWHGSYAAQTGRQD